MPEKKRVLIISFSAIASDPRVMRQIRLLCDRYDVCVLGYGDQPAGVSIRFFGLSRRPKTLILKFSYAVQLIFGLFESYYWNLHEVTEGARLLESRRFDLVIANDTSALPVAIHCAKGAPVMLDAHEYSPAEFEDSWTWKLLFGRYYDYLCRQYLGCCADMTTVCGAIAEEYSRNYGVLPEVIRNAPELQDLEPSRPMAGMVRLVHHGACIRSRRLELMIEAMQYVDQQFSLDLMLTNSDPDYLEELKEMGSRDPRIRFVPPVPMDAICGTIQQYDVGVYLIPPDSLNHRFSLPNKFFEFIQARLAVVVGPSPEMKSLVERFSLGVVSASFSPKDFADAINSVSTEDLLRYKQASDVAARELNFATESRRLLERIEPLLAA